MATVGPKWWHHHGMKIGVQKVDREMRTVVLKASAAQLTISPFKTTTVKGRWLVEWEVVQSMNEKVKGSIIFSREEIETAFGLSQKVPERWDQWLIQQYDAHFAHQGKYIRRGNYLNIPCPGTGHDGDPNISIKLSEQICSAVQNILG